MAYHCADVYNMFCHIVSQALPDESADLISRVRDMLKERYGEEFLPVLDSYSDTDFDKI